jgi:hypothetical protein
VNVAQESKKVAAHWSRWYEFSIWVVMSLSQAKHEW